MSAAGELRAMSPPDIAARKGGAPLVCLTAYSTPMAKLVKHYAELGEHAEAAIAAYARDVRERRFPGDEHVFADAGAIDAVGARNGEQA